MLSLRRRLSTQPGTAAEDRDSEGTVDLQKLAVLTTVYSLVEGVVTYPYDLIKTRQQASPPGSPATRMGTLAYVHTMIQERGPSSLYRGFRWNVFGGVPSEVAYYAIYTHAKELMLQTRIGRQYPSAVYFIAGLLSDVLSVALWVPADIVSQRLQLIGSETHGHCSEMHGPRAQARAPDLANAHRIAAMNPSTHNVAGAVAVSGRPTDRNWLHLRALSSMEVLRAPRSETSLPSSENASAPTRRLQLAPWQLLRRMSTRHDASACAAAGARSGAATALATAEASGMEVVTSIVRREGVLGLWRGTWITMATVAPTSAVWWVTHEEAKRQIAHDTHLSEENALVLTMSGSLAAVSSTVISMPLDVIKTRLQCSELPLTARQVLQNLIREAGWIGLWTGFLPRLVAAVPRSVATVLAYERAIAMCRRPSRQAEMAGVCT